MFLFFRVSLSLSFSPLSLSPPVSLSLSPFLLDVYCKNSYFVCNIASIFFVYPYKRWWGNGHFFVCCRWCWNLSLLPSLSLSLFPLRARRVKEKPKGSKKRKVSSESLEISGPEAEGKWGAEGKAKGARAPRQKPRKEKEGRRFCLFW